MPALPERRQPLHMRHFTVPRVCASASTQQLSACARNGSAMAIDARADLRPPRNPNLAGTSAATGDARAGPVHDLPGPLRAGRSSQATAMQSLLPQRLHLKVARRAQHLPDLSAMLKWATATAAIGTFWVSHERPLVTFFRSSVHADPLMLEASAA